ncbi:hypothetical protein [Sulfuracidifex tepidarius]|uniref:4Fe-4S Mo/W bis-MGD-type domain-containing protein n=1 Tax=Sulfuracidifex tepidarius TaxID=1294262 RepID=A0A510DZY9_9CREN|nr:hypothetical protein [Sulfuracidifex tepidarius]BBG23042.1 hypothetical protein IC006_0326 [Sulfuracidifex tepidarius]BBG25805.1 hypothetical protein IC007_0310 [Sulfuracidifex tepidarius]
MAFLRCYMCKNMCGVIGTTDGKTVRVSANREHPQPGICDRGAAGPYLVNPLSYASFQEVYRSILTGRLIQSTSSW